MDALLVDILHARSAGRISSTGAESAVKLAGALGMQKEALKLPPSVMSALSALRPSPETARAITSGLAASAATAGVGLGIHGLASGARALEERVTKKRDLAKILETFPRLKEDYSEAEINLAYNSIRHMNPHIAKDPLAGGSLLGQVLRQRDAMDPKTMRMEADLAGNLLRLRPEERHVGEEIARDAASAGMMLGFQEASKLRDRKEQQTWQEGQTAQERLHRAGLAADQMAHDKRMKDRDIGVRARQVFQERKAREAENEKDRTHRDAGAAAQHARQVALELEKMTHSAGEASKQRSFMGAQNQMGQAAQDRRIVLEHFLNQEMRNGPLMLDSTGAPILNAKGDLQYYPPAPVEHLVRNTSAPSFLREHFPHIIK